MLNDQENENRYVPLKHIKLEKTNDVYEVINSMLSEEAVLGFEYGYTLAEPEYPGASGKPSLAILPMALRW